MTENIPPPDNDQDRWRRNYESRVRFAVFLVVLLVLGCLGLFLKEAAFFPTYGLPEISLPAADPSVNPYRQPALAAATASGVVTAIVPRVDKMPDGSLQKNFYARTEYYLAKYDGNCYFHHFLGPDAPRYAVGDHVTVSYQPFAADVCGSSIIVE